MTNELVLLPDGPLIDTGQLDEALGWTLEAEGLCRDDTCVIVPTGRRSNATARSTRSPSPRCSIARRRRRRLGRRRDRRTSRARRGALNDLRAPDFVLPDLDGTPHALSDHRSKKRLLVAFSSW